MSLCRGYIALKLFLGLLSLYMKIFDLEIAPLKRKEVGYHSCSEFLAWISSNCIYNRGRRNKSGQPNLILLTTDFNPQEATIYVVWKS